MSELVCYNCGKYLNDKDSTKEHIPSKNLFEGYENHYKVNRITVPACFTCNNSYSLTDEEFRNMIGIIAKRRENASITEKTIRSINRKESSRNRKIFDGFGKVSGIYFNKTPIENFHKKIFKGLFYHQYGRVLSIDYFLFVNINEDDWSHEMLGFLGYLKELFNFKFSGHPSILKYSIQPFRIGITNKSKIDLLPDSNEGIFVGYLDFNEEHASLILAVNKDLIGA